MTADSIPFQSDTAGISSEATDSAQRILAAADILLKQGESLLGGLTPETYALRVATVLNGSIGGHYRHCLDHFVSLLRGANRAFIDFDERARDVRVESDPTFAIRTTQEIRMALRDWSPSMMSIAVGARCEVSYQNGDAPVTGSTLGRELVYAITHAIHHYALISVIARLQGIELPADFGVAPSTSAQQQRSATAASMPSR